MRPIAAPFLALSLAVTTPSAAWELDLASGVDGVGGNLLAARLTLPLVDGVQWSLVGERQENGAREAWHRLSVALDSDPIDLLQVGWEASWEGSEGLERWEALPRLVIAPGAWEIRAEGLLSGLRLRLNQPRRPFTDQDFIELSALGGGLGVAYYGWLGWSIHIEYRREDYSRDLAVLSRRPDLALRLFTPAAVNAGYALEERGWNAGLMRYGDRGRTGLWWGRSRSAVDGAHWDTISLTIDRGRFSLAAGISLEQGLAGLYLRPGLSWGSPLQ